MATTRARPRSSDEPQGATFIELFFDLVFVYAITQVTSVLAHDLTWGGAARAVVIAWLVWWAWQQFTWTLSPADTTHPSVEVMTLVATGIAFFMARSVDEIFLGNAWFFLVPYLAVRLLGMALYAWVGGDDRQMARSMGLFGLASAPAAVALIVGAVAGAEARVWWWALAIVLDLGAGVFVRRVRWRIHVSHFAERHGLIVIIALGESLIAIGVASDPLSASVESFVTKGAGVALVGVLWWLYFGWFKGWLEERVATSDGIDLLRNAYSFAHFAIVAGVVAMAASLEEVVAHPEEPLGLGAAVAMAIGVTAYMGSVAILAWTAGRLVLGVRLVGVVLAVATVLVGWAVGLSGVFLTAGVAAIGLAVAISEHQTQRVDVAAL